MTNDERLTKLENDVKALATKNSNLIAEKNAQNKRITELESKLDGGSLYVQQLTVGDPDSPYKVVIAGNSTSAGIWINGKQEDGIVALYNNNMNGAVVGVWGHPQETALDIAFSAKNGPTIQVFDRKQGQVYFIDTTQIATMAQGTKLGR